MNRYILKPMWTHGWIVYFYDKKVKYCAYFNSVKNDYDHNNNNKIQNQWKLKQENIQKLSFKGIGLLFQNHFV